MALDAWTHSSSQGRIQPTNWTPVEGSYVLCLGSDVEGDVQAFAADDYVQWEQTADFGTNATLRFRARTRGPTELPKVVQVTAVAVAAYTIIIDGVNHTYSAGASDTLVSIANGLAALVADSGRATPRIVGAGDTVQLDDLGESTLAISGDLAIGTFTWYARCYIDGSVYFEQTILEGRERDRADGGAMVRVQSDAGGDHDVAFRLQVESDLAGAIAELELPAFYVDNITLAAP